VAARDARRLKDCTRGPGAGEWNRALVSHQKYKSGPAVDTSGQFPDRSAFAGRAEFKKLALRRGDFVARC
jgi:hypothetical protein